MFQSIVGIFAIEKQLNLKKHPFEIDADSAQRLVNEGRTQFIQRKFDLARFEMVLLRIHVGEFVLESVQIVNVHI